MAFTVSTLVKANCHDDLPGCGDAGRLDCNQRRKHNDSEWRRAVRCRVNAA